MFERLPLCNKSSFEEPHHFDSAMQQFLNKSYFMSSYTVKFFAQSAWGVRIRLANETSRKFSDISDIYSVQIAQPLKVI
jgi:hypothetical protein